MIEAVLTILAGLIGIAGIIFKSRYSKESIKKRNNHERDKEIAEKDHTAKASRLSDLFDAVKLRNAKKGSGGSS